jgi:hypothetical protein
MDDLLGTVRALALKQRCNTPQIFISLREAAKRFDVPVSLVSAIYKQLSTEGVLSTVRGSHTILLGRAVRRDLTVRGFIGMPASVLRLQTSAEYRRCFVALTEELHRQGFVTVQIFFQPPDDKVAGVIDRLKKKSVDTVIWLLPDGADRDTALRLRDLGIRFVGVNIAPLSGLSCRYEVRREAAVGTIIRSWLVDARITRAAIVRTGRETAVDARRLTNLKGLVRAVGLECDIVSVEGGEISTFLKSLCLENETGIILPAPAAAMLGWRAIDTITDVLKSCRVALIDGAMDFPMADATPQADVDLISVGWPAAAKLIVGQLVSGEALIESRSTVLQARAHLRVSLRDAAAL